MTGKIQSWSTRGYGIVAVTFKEVYFLHASSVTEIPDGVDVPPVGAVVHFDVAPAHRGGRYPQAVNARIIVAAGGAL
jgi:hypothetical protein